MSKYLPEYLGYRHCAVNLHTGEILSCERSNTLKRAIAERKRINRKHGDFRRERWRFCHDHGKRWIESGWDIR
jgi:hypothetical protein